ncbi:MAG: hypothetical protein C0394_00365 [Syntrophus sp. (in: bacteria)]|nr:hypothetical protein [Syntrophus sp. (in: bacteria)]
MHIRSIGWFRGLAILFVVMTHVDPTPLQNSSFGVYLQRFFGNGAFLFTLISGYLFWHLRERYSYVDFMAGKIKNVIVPYVVVLTPAIAIYAAIGKIDCGFSAIVREYLVGGGVLAPLWFIPMIVLIFLSAPAIVFSADRPWYPVLVLAAVFISLTSFRPYHHDDPIYMLFHLYGVFLLGVYLKQKEVFLRNNALIIALLSIPFVGLFLCLDVMQYREGLPFFWPLLKGKLELNYGQIQKLFASLFFLALFFVLEKRNWAQKGFYPLDVLAKYSFGIFFFHWYFYLLKNAMVKAGIIEKCYAGFMTFFIDFSLFTFLSLLVCKIAFQFFGEKARYLTGVRY